MQERTIIQIAAGVVATLVLTVGGCMAGMPQYNVYQARLEGQATEARSQGAKQALVSTATAEKEAAQLRADAIAIMGEAAKQFPEYRQQELLSAFGEALREGKISQIVYWPTEGGMPITEATRLK